MSSSFTTKFFASFVRASSTCLRFTHCWSCNIFGNTNKVNTVAVLSIIFLILYDNFLRKYFTMIFVSGAVWQTTNIFQTVRIDGSATS